MAKFLDSSGLSHFWAKIKDKFYKKGDTFPEAYLSWGGRNLSTSYAPIDAAMVPELGANRLALIPAAGVQVEYSRDGGSTWTDYGASNNAKSMLFSELGASLYIGKADSSHKATAAYQLRITITTDLAKVYTVLNKFVIYCTTNGSQGSYVSIDKALKNSESTWVNVVNKQAIGGWSGYNVINVSNIETYGNKPASQYSKIRFTFGCTSGSTTYNGLNILKILGFGGVGWTTPNNLAKYGRPFTYDVNQNVTFPAQVTATNFSGKINNHTVGKDVPSDAEFTDTTYSDATTSARGLMTAADKTKLNGIATGAEVNQNAYSNVKIGSTTIAADAKTDTIELVAGSNVTITPDASADKVTIAATDTKYSTMSASEANTGTATISRVITAKVLSETIAAQTNKIQVKTASITVPANNGGDVNVTWDSAMPSADYYIGITRKGLPNGFDKCEYVVDSQTATGCKIHAWNTYSQSITQNLLVIAISA